tara:strand:+ start:26467 stop:27720 length:1254 start_codon:yes stop_codon:yes gene_type:complete
MIIENSYRKDNCRLCNSKNLEDVIELTPTPPGNNFLSKNQLNNKENYYPLIVRFCHSCAHVQLADVVDPVILFQDDYKYVSGTSPIFVNHFRNYVTDVLSNYSIPQGSLIVDIGSNDGTCLSFFKENGFEVLGVDPATEIAAKATAEGINTIADFFSKSLAEENLDQHGPAHIITSHNTCAHVDDLNDVFCGVRNWLHDDGLFIFEVGYLLDVYKNNWFDTIYHEHLDYHSVKPFVSLFDNLEMELISVKRISPQGGSIRLVVQKQNGRYKKDESVDEIIKLEESIGLDNAEIFKDFNNRINDTKKDLLDLLINLKNEDNLIAGFGAPTKSTTLLTHFNINNELMTFIVDDNPLKQGKFTPGYHIPIFDSDEVYRSMPDYLVILAWNFADSIMKKHQEYLNKGGKFILPMPEVKIIN